MKANRKLHLGFVGLLVLAATQFAPAQAREIDPVKSTVTVRVFKSGVFSAFGHNHEIVAPVSGNIDETKKSVEISVRASDMKVLDPDRPEKERMEVQQTMLGPQVLEVQRFPAIQFRSTSVEGASRDKFTVSGELTLHGQTRPATVQVVRTGNGLYTATAALKQTDFGMTPVAVAGGTVKVKDEVKLEFVIQESGQREAGSRPTSAEGGQMWGTRPRLADMERRVKGRGQGARDTAAKGGGVTKPTLNHPFANSAEPFTPVYLPFGYSASVCPSKRW